MEDTAPRTPRHPSPYERRTYDPQEAAEHPDLRTDEQMALQAGERLYASPRDPREAPDVAAADVIAMLDRRLQTAEAEAEAARGDLEAALRDLAAVEKRCAALRDEMIEQHGRVWREATRERHEAERRMREKHRAECQDLRAQIWDLQYALRDLVRVHDDHRAAPSAEKAWASARALLADAEASA